MDTMVAIEFPDLSTRVVPAFSLPTTDAIAATDWREQTITPRAWATPAGTQSYTGLLQQAAEQTIWDALDGEWPCPECGTIVTPDNVMWALAHRGEDWPAQCVSCEGFADGIVDTASTYVAAVIAAGVTPRVAWLMGQAGVTLAEYLADPAAAVRGPKHSVKRGKTPVLASDEARQLLDAIDVSTVIGLRDRVLIGLMVYSFACVGAAVSMKVEAISPRIGAYGFGCTKMQQAARNAVPPQP